MKPYVKLAYTLVLVGMGIFAFERFGLNQLGGPSGIHLSGLLLSILVIAPIVLIIAGCIVFMVGRVRRL